MCWKHAFTVSHITRQDGRDAYSNLLGGEPYQARVIDYGSIYASKSWAAADGRRLWLGWVYEDSKGCTELCADGTPFIRQVQNWQGAQTLVRVVSYDQEVQALVFSPAPELAALRVPGPPLYDGQLVLGAGDGRGALGASSGGQPAGTPAPGSGAQLLHGAAPPAAVMLLPEVPPGRPQVSAQPGTQQGPGAGSTSPSGRRQMEVSLAFNLTLAAAGSANASAPGDQLPFEVGVRLLTGNNSFIRIVLNGTTVAVPAAPTNQTLGPSSLPAPSQQLVIMVQSLAVWVDRTHGGGMTQPTEQGGPVKLPNGGVPASNLSLHIFLDRSIMEVYALGGRAVVTSRIYPIPLLPPDTADVPAASITEEWLGAWGLEVVADWAAGPVSVGAQVMELGSCWIDDVLHD